MSEFLSHDRLPFDQMSDIFLNQYVIDVADRILFKDLRHGAVEAARPRGGQLCVYELFLPFAGWLLCSLASSRLFVWPTAFI